MSQKPAATTHKVRSLTMQQRLAAILEELWIFLFSFFPTPAGMLLRLFAWGLFFKKCGFVRFGQDLTITGMGNMAFGNNIRIGKSCFLSASQGSLTLGDYVALSPCVHLGADNGEICLGNHVAIGPCTILRAANHHFSDTAIPIMCQGHDFGRIVIDDDVWIGANCVIAANVRIGRGAVIGAGAVVTRDVEPWSIVGGVPAKLIGWRKKPVNGDFHAS